MISTKIISRFLTAIAISTFFVSCTSEREKDEAETKECLEEKTKDEKHKSIEESLANYDFLTARKYLSCYPNTCYNFNGDRLSNSIGENDGNKYHEKLTSIVKAEISFLIANGESVKAQNVASESGMENEYQKAIPNVINTLMEKRDYESVFSILTTWTFKTSFNPDVPANRTSEYYPSNLKYNEEAQKYNDMIDNVLKSAVINDDSKTAKKCLPLYVPFAITNPKTAKKDEDDQKSILKNEARIAAKQKMAEAGM
jgi:hypothetical protein